jgi:predicted DNA-binding WGR domain protein
MQIKLVYIDSSKNSQKFWHGEVLSNGDLKVCWGRIGASGSSKIHPIGNAETAGLKLNQLVREKQSKGYTYAARDAKGEPLQFTELSIGPTILEMIESLEGWLTPWQSQIDIKFDRQTGQLISPLGNIDRRRLQEARTALEEADQYRRSYSGWFPQKAEDYLRLIPVVSKGRLNAQLLLGDDQKIQEQQEYLNLLESCLAMIWDMRKLISAEMENPATTIADKAQWIDWGGNDASIATTASIDDGRMVAIEW